jgi:hypothetical protein
MWEKNMTVCHKPSITANRGEDYTQAGKSTIFPYEKVLKWPQTGVRWFIFQYFPHPDHIVGWLCTIFLSYA